MIPVLRAEEARELVREALARAIREHCRWRPDAAAKAARTIAGRLHLPATVELRTLPGLVHRKLHACLGFGGVGGRAADYVASAVLLALDRHARERMRATA